MVISAALAIILLVHSGPQSVPAGTRLQAKLETPIRTNTSDVGDPVVALVNAPLLMDEKVVVPRGSRLHGRVELLRAGTPDMEGWVRLVFREIHFPDGRRFSTWMTNSFNATPHKHAARHVIYIGLGAAAGAIIGKGRSRTAAILGGAFGGFLLSSNTGKGARDVSLKEGQTIWLQLGQELMIAEDGRPDGINF